MNLNAILICCIFTPWVTLAENKKPSIPGFLLASWIKDMLKLAPKGVGVDKIYFLKVAYNPDQVGETRFHPLSDYLFEDTITSAQTGKFKIEKAFKTEKGQDKKLLGFWISSNGEGTKSKFKIKLTKIELN